MRANVSYAVEGKVTVTIPEAFIVAVTMPSPIQLQTPKLEMISVPSTGTLLAVPNILTACLAPPVPIELNLL